MNAFTSARRADGLGLQRPSQALGFRGLPLELQTYPAQRTLVTERAAPDLMRPCRRCGCCTPTVFRLLSSGHCLNGCAVCGTARLGRPYVSRSFLSAHPQPTLPGFPAAEGFCRDQHT